MSSAGAVAARSAISAMKAATTCGSNWLPAMSRSSWHAASWPTAVLYARSVVMAS